MNCPHCSMAFHDTWQATMIAVGGASPQRVQETETTFFVRWRARATCCPSCRQAIIDLDAYEERPNEHVEFVKELRVIPRRTARKQVDPVVPDSIRDDYEEACAVFDDSAKASAALSRRCLQAIMRGQGYHKRDLRLEIEAVLNEPDPRKALPTFVHQTVDAIRAFGNFSAHPIHDLLTTEIIDVEPTEAEWCLTIIEALFDHYFVKPAQAQAMKNDLNAKLLAAGKPPIQ